MLARLVTTIMVTIIPRNNTTRNFFIFSLLRPARSGGASHVARTQSGYGIGHLLGFAGFAGFTIWQLAALRHRLVFVADRRNCVYYGSRKNPQSKLLEVS
jgi:hypothetical protein